MLSNCYYLTRPAAVLRVTGEDAASFLQSQFSNDLRAGASSQPVVYGLWLTVKGKVRADSVILRLAEEDFIVMSYHTPAVELRAIVEENLIADEVEVEDLTEGAQLLSCWGPLAVRALERGGRAAGSYYRLQNDLLFAGRRSRQPCADLLRLSGFIKPKSFLTEGVWEAVDETVTEAERIRSGIPRIPVDIGPGDLPQEGGLEAVAVSFRKGCYLGQEVMARLHAMGRVNRGLYRVSFAGAVPELPVAVTADNKAAGELRSAFCEDGQSCGLALLKHRVVEAGWALSLADGRPLLSS